MTNKYIFTVLLICIGVGALLLRTHGITRIPPSLSWDEVSIGYNAYSILKTGRDEHGRFLPIDTFIAYGDYKPPLSIYATVPFVALLGLTDLAVRLPSALLGTLTVILTYFLVLELFRSHKSVRVYALAAMGLLAISPWHINLSRVGFEANIALFFEVLGIWLVLRTRTRPNTWYIAWLPFVAAFYTFNSSRVFSVLFAPALILFTYRDIRKHIRKFAIGAVIAICCLLPILPHILSPQARLRFTEVNIFTDLSVVEKSNARIAREPGSIVGKIVNNRRVGYARSFILHFLDNMEPQFLFGTGDGNPKFSIQDVGQLYMVEAPFLVIGIYSLFREYPTTAWLLLWWLIAAIIPAATARETPHALRTLNSLPTWQLFVAFGILASYRFIRWRRLFAVILVCIYGLSLIYYLHTYYRHYPVDYSGEWQFGYREAIRAIEQISSKYSYIQITDSIGRPYMYTLFYTRTDPKVLATTKKSYFDAAGFYHVDGFGKYRFGGKLPDLLDPRTLYIWESIPSGAHVIDTINLLNGSPVLFIFDSGAVK